MNPFYAIAFASVVMLMFPDFFLLCLALFVTGGIMLGIAKILGG
jgi:hypothetical protein